MQQSCDVLICGARVAGGSLALLLAELGHHVVLIDRATFPSPVNSTHFFRGNGFVGTLDRLGLLDDVLALESPPFHCEYWYVHGAPTPETAPPQDPGEVGFNLSARREPLDAILVDRAHNHPNIELFEDTRYVRPVWDQDRLVGTVVQNGIDEKTVRSRIVVGADGQHSRLARAVNARFERKDPAIRAMLYRYVVDFEGPPTGNGAGPEFSVVENDIAYAFPSDHGIACIGVSFPLAEFGDGWHNPETTLDMGLHRHPGIVARVDAATPVSKIMGAGQTSNFVKTPAGPGWALVGDAGMRQDPWTGRGMDCAGVHAEYLAESIDAWLSGRTDESTAFASYHRRRNDHGLPLYEETQTLGRDLRQMEMMQT